MLIEIAIQKKKNSLSSSYSIFYIFIFIFIFFTYLVNLVNFFFFFGGVFASCETRAKYIDIRSMFFF